MTKKIFFINLLFLLGSLLIAIRSGKMFYSFLLLVAIYLFVACAKACRGYENMWIFMLVAVAFLPINISFIAKYHRLSRYLVDGPIGKIVLLATAYAVLFSIEEILAGLIGRIIWPHQKMDE